MTLTEFLLARIAEDEAVALAASPGPWHLNAEGDEVVAVDDIEVATAFALSGPQLRATATHIARHDPARVLAECEAKRRIVGQHLGTVSARDKSTDPLKHLVLEVAVETLGDTLKSIALPYADHPDYDPAWRT